MNTNTPTTLSLFYGALGRSPRPTRMALYLARNAKHTVCAEGVDPTFDMGQICFVPLKARSFASKILRRVMLFCGMFERDVWNSSAKTAFEHLRMNVYTHIFCHDIALLPIACALKDTATKSGICAKIIMDLREYYPKEFENSFLWRITLGRFYRYLCKTYLPSVDVACTVSPGLAKAYQEHFALSCALIPSYSLYQEISPHATQAAQIRLIHHGGASAGRNLEGMIDVVKKLPNCFSLDYMLIAKKNDPYLAKLRLLAADCPRIRFLPPVPMQNIVPTIAQYDIGVFYLLPNTFNHEYTLPNKIFEYIQARLAVVVSPCPDMRDFVLQQGVGVVADDFTPESFAQALCALTPQRIDSYKYASHSIARHCAWERHEAWLHSLIQPNI